MRRWVGGLLSIWLGACASATMQASGDVDGGLGDPGGEMMAPARLGVAEGQVSFWRPGANGWEPARINTALAAGDVIDTGVAGTAEIQIGGRDFVRLSADTQLAFVAFDRRLARFRVASGLASFDLRSTTSDRAVTIDTAHAAIAVGASGYYRVDTRGGAMRLTVRHGGRATLTLADGGHLHVAADEELVVPDTARPVVERRAAAAGDAWDRWNDARTDFHTQSASQRQLPAEIYGASDLDRHGQWRGIEPYGTVWVPAVASGWVPYSAGRWQQDPFYGWTWVDDAPWGWSTSHYGRWVFLDGYWAWAPGPRVARPVYAPALVAFYGAGAGIGWVALGWDEPLLPWWGRPGFRGSPWWAGWGGPRRIGAADRISHRNREVPHAVVGMRNDRFGHDHVRDARLPPPAVRDLRDIRGDHPAKPLRGTIAPPSAASPPARPQPPPRTSQNVTPRFEAPAGDYIRRLPQGRPAPGVAPVAPMPGQVPPPGRRANDDFRRGDGQAARGSVFRPPGSAGPGRGAHGQPGGRFQSQPDHD